VSTSRWGWVKHLGIKPLVINMNSRPNASPLHLAHLYGIYNSPIAQTSVANFPNTNVSSGGHLPISGGNSSNSNPAKSNSVWPSSAALSINCNNSSRVISFCRFDSLHFIVTEFFGWWGIARAPQSKKPGFFEFLCCHQKFSQKPGFSPPASNLRNRGFLSFYAVTNNSRKNPVSRHPRLI
jgi:hypothetical protein